MIALAFGMVVSVIGWLLNRSINSIDKKLDTTCNAVETIKLEMVGYQKLAEYLKNDVESLKAENTTLRKSFNYIDKVIYAAGLSTNHPTPMPPQ